MSKSKGSVPVPEYVTKEPAKEPERCRYCGCELNMEITSNYSNVPGKDSSTCIDCTGMFKMELGFMEWSEPIPQEIIDKAERAAERHPELAPKVRKWRKQYRIGP